MKLEHDICDVMIDRISLAILIANEASDRAKKDGVDPNLLWRNLMECDLQMLLIEFKMGCVLSVQDIKQME